MKSLPLNKLKKKSKKYFRNLGVVTRGRRKKTTIRYIVERIYETLPKEYRKANDADKSLLITSTVNRIWYDEGAQYNPYKAMYDYTRRNYKHGWGGTLDEVYKRFRTEFPAQYSKYNTYVYRLGYSASKWFFDNAHASLSGSVLYVSVELPIKSSGIVYNSLEIVWDRSGDDMTATMQ